MQIEEENAGKFCGAYRNKEKLNQSLIEGELK